MVQSEALREHLIRNYKYLDGQLIGRRGKPIGGSVGVMSFTYTIDGVHTRMLVHRAIFLMEFGHLPELIDHIDQDSRNNLRDNLRDADKMINAINIDSFSRKESVLPRGVDRSGTKFTARIKIRGKKVHLGTFDTLEEAGHVANTRRNEELDRRQAERAIY